MNTCPFCRSVVESRAVNHSLKSLIDTFAAKRLQINRGEVPGFSDAPPQAAGGAGWAARPSGLAAAGAGVMRPPTGPGSSGGGYGAYGGGMGVMPHYGMPGSAPPASSGSAGSGAGADAMDSALKYLHE